jgi:hypothetical protein
VECKIIIASETALHILPVLFHGAIVVNAADFADETVGGGAKR